MSSEPGNRIESPTLEDVARLARVSTATVSRCLNTAGMVRPETRERVEKAVKELGYTPHFGARALASNRTGTIGVVIPTMENAIFARGIQAMEETLSERNVTLFVATSNYDPARELEKIKALAARGVDALALIGFERPPEAYRTLAQRNVPFALLWNYLPDSHHPCVGFDNRRAAANMARHVLKHGHRRIAMIAGRTAGNDRATARVAGVKDSLAAEQLSLDRESVIECHYSIAQGEAAAEKLLSAPQAPSALICGNDVLAVGALRTAKRRGLSVPGDVSIVGFDDIDLASVVEPGLTTVRAPHRRMGRAAAEMLLALTRNEPMETRICFDAEIVERESLANVSP